MNFIEVFDNALTSEQCKLMIDYMNSSELIPGAVGIPGRLQEQPVTWRPENPYSHGITWGARSITDNLEAGKPLQP